MYICLVKDSRSHWFLWEISVNFNPLFFDSIPLLCSSMRECVNWHLEYSRVQYSTVHLSWTTNPYSNPTPKHVHFTVPYWGSLFMPLLLRLRNIATLPDGRRGIALISYSYQFVPYSYLQLNCWMIPITWDWRFFEVDRLPTLPYPLCHPWLYIRLILDLILNLILILYKISILCRQFMEKDCKSCWFSYHDFLYFSIRYSSAEN